MKKHFIQVLIFVMIISLTGIIVVQLFWIKNAIEVKELEYDKSIRNALDEIIKKIERKQQLIFLSEHIDKVITITDKEDSILWVSDYYDYFSGDSSFTIVKSNQDNNTNVNVNVSRLGKNIKSTINYNSPKSNPAYVYIGDNAQTIDNRVIVMADSGSKKVIKNLSTTYKIRKAKQFQKNIEDMVIEFETRFDPVADRIDFDNLNEIVHQEIIEKGIDNQYQYAIINSENDSIENKSAGFDEHQIKNSYKANLFPNDLVNKNMFLHLYLPGKNSFIYKSMVYMLLGSMFFTLVIILIFGFTIRIIYKQKKISEIKSDFINNMTHEFKTPIATISLAADSISNPKVVTDQGKINEYLRIIKEENRRMNNQVESVLQMSLLEKDKFKLLLKESDLHNLIKKAIQNIEIQIKQKNGNLESDLAALKSTAMIDEIHFLNIIHNLLDNANKYSTKNPLIKLSTKNQNGTILISVTDNGIGIKKEDLVRIFDKFYRVSTGNIHNVKGFGLGLSYVRAIVNQFGGTIRATSEFGKGSTFEISLPVIQLKNEE